MQSMLWFLLLVGYWIEPSKVLDNETVFGLRRVFRGNSPNQPPLKQFLPVSDQSGVIALSRYPESGRNTFGSLVSRLVIAD